MIPVILGLLYNNHIEMITSRVNIIDPLQDLQFLEKLKNFPKLVVKERADIVSLTKPEDHTIERKDNGISINGISLTEDQIYNCIERLPFSFNLMKMGAFKDPVSLGVDVLIEDSYSLVTLMNELHKETKLIHVKRYMIFSNEVAVMDGDPHFPDEDNTVVRTDDDYDKAVLEMFSVLEQIKEVTASAEKTSSHKNRSGIEVSQSA